MAIEIKSMHMTPAGGNRFMRGVVHYGQTLDRTAFGSPIEDEVQQYEEACANILLDLNSY